MQTAADSPYCTDVGRGDRLVEPVDPLEADDRTEHLVAAERHVGPRVGEHRRREEAAVREPSSSGRAPAARDGRAVGHGLGDGALHRRDRVFVDERTHA